MSLPPKKEYPNKYGWEIADDVQRFASGSADMLFVPAFAHDAVVEENSKLKNALERIIGLSGLEVTRKNQAGFIAYEALKGMK